MPGTDGWLAQPLIGHGHLDWSTAEGLGVLNLPIIRLVLLGLTGHGVTETGCAKKSLVVLAPT